MLLLKKPRSGGTPDQSAKPEVEHVPMRWKFSHEEKSIIKKEGLPVRGQVQQQVPVERQLSRGERLEGWEVGK